MIRIITANVNGIRSAVKKGFFEWLKKQDADFVCLQELKAQDADLTDEIKKLDGYSFLAHYASKRGYSGCAIYSKYSPLSTRIGFGNEEFDLEGRYVEMEFEPFILVCVYFPSGSTSEERQEAKFRFLDVFHDHLESLKKRKQVIFCGDVNIAHKEIDIKNWKGNLSHSGFLPEEREWLTNLFDRDGWVDVFRKLNKEENQFTWWSNRGKARINNVGWRIDYQISTKEISDTAVSTSIYKEERFSDHAPLIMDYDFLIKK